MKLSTLFAAFLWPTLALAQDSMPTSAPVVEAQPELALSAPPTEAPTYDRSSEKAYKLSLYSTIAGLGGSMAFTTLGGFTARRLSLNEEGLKAARLSTAMFSVAGAFGTLALIGPSLGHFYAGESERGVRLLLRRAIIPPVLMAGGVASAVVSFGVLGSRLAQDEPIKAGPFVGIGAGVALAAAGGISWWILTFKHIEDARQSPSRVAAKQGLRLADKGALLPAPMYDPSTNKVGLGATLQLNF